MTASRRGRLCGVLRCSKPRLRFFCVNEQASRPHRLVWFEIPAVDLARAVKFYETLLGLTLKVEEFHGVPMAVFPREGLAVTGCLTTRGTPGAEGVLAFLNADPSLDEVLSRVTAAGGTLVQPKLELPPGMGAYAKIRDCEGNLVGLHALA
jgi:uncharacterized protein